MALIPFWGNALLRTPFDPHVYQVIFPIRTGGTTSSLQPSMSSKDCSACSFPIVFFLSLGSFFIPLWWSTPSWTLEVEPSTALQSSLSVQLAYLQYSALWILTTLAFVNSQLLSSQLRESTELCLGSSLLCCGVEMLSRQKRG